MTPGPEVVVVGGGWAGIACATALAEKGTPVTLLEERGRLGGRACSFSDAASGEEVDNGQHLMMACFTDSLRLLERIGTRDGVRFQKNLEVPMAEPSGARNILRCPPLPSPLHLLGGILRHGSLGAGDRIGLLRAWPRIRREIARARPGRGGGAGPGHPAGAAPAGSSGEDSTVEEWLDRCGQTPGSRRGFWRPLALAALNEDPLRASSRLFLSVLREGILAGRAGSCLGVPRVPLSRLVEPARRYLEDRGGRVIVNGAAARVRMAGGKIRAVLLRDGSEIVARCVVCAVPPQALARILPEEIPEGDPFFGRARQIESSPILSVHLWYDREVLDVPFLGLLDSPIHWIFNARRDGPGPEGSTSRLALVTSGARDLIDRPVTDLARLADGEVRRYLPRARTATLVRSLVVKERQATPSPRAGSEPLRPSQSTPIPGLFLAGDWTDTGLPGTLESAARSGHLCAGMIPGNLPEATPAGI